QSHRLNRAPSDSPAPTPGFDPKVPFRREELLEHVTHVRLILDHQHPGSLLRCVRHRSGRRILGGLLGGGETKRESAAAARGALHLDRAAVAIHDPPRDRKPEAGSLRTLGRKKRGEDPPAYAFWYPVAVVFSRHGHVVALAFDAKDEASAVRHGLQGVDEQIHERFAQLLRG